MICSAAPLSASNTGLPSMRYSLLRLDEQGLHPAIIDPQAVRIHGHGPARFKKPHRPIHTRRVPVCRIPCTH